MSKNPSKECRERKRNQHFIISARFQLFPENSITIRSKLFKFRWRRSLAEVISAPVSRLLQFIFMNLSFRLGLKLQTAVNSIQQLPAFTFIVANDSAHTSSYCLLLAEGSGRSLARQCSRGLRISLLTLAQIDMSEHQAPTLKKFT